jgi:hypothetical protein
MRKRFGHLVGDEKHSRDSTWRVEETADDDEA